jgi:hypothetical protein
MLRNTTAHTVLLPSPTSCPYVEHLASLRANWRSSRGSASRYADLVVDDLVDKGLRDARHGGT